MAENIGKVNPDFRSRGWTYSLKKRRCAHLSGAARHKRGLQVPAPISVILEVQQHLGEGASAPWPCRPPTAWSGHEGHRPGGPIACRGQADAGPRDQCDRRAGGRAWPIGETLRMPIHRPLRSSTSSHPRGDVRDRIKVIDLSSPS